MKKQNNRSQSTITQLQRRRQGAAESQPLVKRQRADQQTASGKKGPSQLSLPMLGVILAVGAIATALGIWHVEIHFQVRDYQIESARLESLTKVRRDEAKRLETELGNLTRDSSLREAAIGPLGMVEPETDVVTGIQLDPRLVAELEKIESEVSEDLAEKRAAISTFTRSKEDSLSISPDL